MKKGGLTREQAIAAVGLEEVEKVEQENCEPTGRLQTDGSVEWKSSIRTPSDDLLILYYYTTPEDSGVVGEDNSWDIIDWDDKIGGYEIESV
jgi:hypothetical protein